MGSIQPYRGSSMSGRPSRDLSRISQHTDLQLAGTAAAAEIESARLDGLQAIAGNAMHGVALVSQLEQQLSQTGAARHQPAAGHRGHARLGLSRGGLPGGAAARPVSVYVIVVTGLLSFCLGVVTVALLAWFSPITNPREFERRQAEQQLQHLSHGAMVQMLSAARQARFGGPRPDSD